MTGDPYYSRTGLAQSNRKAKVLALVMWCLGHGVTATELVAAAPSTVDALLRRIAREAGVNAPSNGRAGETWQEVLYVLGDEAPTPAGLVARPDWLPPSRAPLPLARSLGTCPYCSRPIRWVSAPPAADDPEERPTLVALDVENVDAGPDLWLVDERTLTARPTTAPTRERLAGDPLLWQAHRAVCASNPRALAEAAHAAGDLPDRCECCGAVLDPAVVAPGPWRDEAGRPYRTPDPTLHPTCKHTRACKHDEGQPRRSPTTPARSIRRRVA